MATNFPGSQDNFTNPTSSDTLDSPDHAAQHTNVNDAVEAIELALLDGAPLHIDDTNERVGIGVTNPSSILEVGDPLAARLILDDQGGTVGTNTHSKVEFQASGTRAGHVGFNNTSAGIMGLVNADGEVRLQTDNANQILLRTNNSTRVTVTGTGDVGIGITSPTDTLDVNGTLNVRDHIDFSDTTPDASNRIAIYPHGYDLYVDNAGAGTDNTRLWLNGPDEGEVVIGPRSGGSTLGNMRIRSDDISLEGDVSVTGDLRVGGDLVGSVLVGSGSYSSALVNSFTGIFTTGFRKYVIIVTGYTSSSYSSTMYFNLDGAQGAYGTPSFTGGGYIKSPGSTSSFANYSGNMRIGACANYGTSLAYIVVDNPMQAQGKGMSGHMTTGGTAYTFGATANTTNTYSGFKIQNSYNFASGNIYVYGMSE